MVLLRNGVWALALVSLAGCFGQGSAQKSVDQVAVVDLDEVARRIGRDTVMANSIAARTRNLNSQLKQLQQNLRQTLASKEKTLTQTPAGKGTVSQTNGEAKVDQLRQEANLRLNQAQRKAQQAITKHRLALIRKFRKEAMDYVKEISRERGIKIVLTNNDSVVFMYEDPVDLTAQVAKRMRANAPARPATQKTAQRSQKTTR